MADPATRTIAVVKPTRAMRLWSGGLMVSGVIGVFSGVTGLLLNLMFLLRIAENEGLMGILSIWLLVLAFPMLWLTSHCLDKVDTLDKQIRVARCERTSDQENSPPGQD